MTRWMIRVPLPGLFALGAVLLVGGCGGAGGVSTVPVDGQIVVNKKPLEKGTVAFHPDASKGNTSALVPASDVIQGKYTLFTNGRAGAPPGWYKVTLTEIEELDSTKPTPKSKVNKSIYIDPAKTALAVEVTGSPTPGAYNFDVNIE